MLCSLKSRIHHIKYILYRFLATPVDFKINLFSLLAVNVTQPFFKANSFLGVQRPDLKYNTKVYMRFKAAKFNGLLFYVSEKADSSNGDFFAISLWQG